MTQQAYCRNCGQFVAPTEGINWIFFILFTTLFIVSCLIYFFWKAGKGGKDWGKPE
jgi:flagellar basal body-associated protein FliL